MSYEQRCSRRRFLKGVGLTGAAVVLGPGCSSDDGSDGSPDADVDSDADGGNQGPPNIVYIYSDQHRGDALGFLGDPVLQTPSFDALAAEGVAFPRCYTNSPLCRPGRATMMTGLYPSDHGVWNNNNVADPDGPSHVRRLRDDAGYLTAVIGKTHLHHQTEHLDGAADILRRWGFEQSVELTGPSESSTIESAWTDHLGAAKYGRFRDYIEHYRESYFDHDQGLLPPPDQAPWNLGIDDHLDVFCGQSSADWLRAVPGDRPFYLQVGFGGPHPPFDATTDWRQRYPVDDTRLPLGAGVVPPSPTSAMYHQVRSYFGGPTTEAEARAIRALYYAKIALIDAQVGQIISVLRERGLLERTWIIYGSDHGEMAGEHGLVGKIVFLEGSISIPLIMRPPTGAHGWISQALTDQVDVTAAIERIAGLTPGPDEGRPLREIIDGGQAAQDAHQGKEHVFGQVAAPDGTPFLMVRTESHKLVTQGQNVIELYDLQQDPHENVNRAGDAALASVQTDLADRLRDRFEQ